MKHFNETQWNSAEHVTSQNWTPNSCSALILHLKTFHMFIICATCGVPWEGGSCVSSLLSQAVLWDLQPRCPELFPNFSVSSRTLPCLPPWMMAVSKHHPYPAVHSCHSAGEPWFSHQPPQMVCCINTHPVQAAGFQTHTVLLHTNVTGRTILHWKRNRSNNLQSCFDLGLFC